MSRYLIVSDQHLLLFKYQHYLLSIVRYITSCNAHRIFLHRLRAFHDNQPHSYHDNSVSHRETGVDRTYVEPPEGGVGIPKSASTALYV
jgi:hypothetical protein